MLKDLFISPDTTIRKAVEVLNEQHKRIVLIVDSDQKLLGVLSDSDIRRLIIKSESFDQPVSNVMVKNPLTVTMEYSDKSVIHLMKQKQIHQIPVIDHENRVVDLKLIDDIIQSGINAEAFILAGGLGTRLHPITQEIPKPLVKVGGKEILFTIIDGLIDAGFQKITLALNYKSEMIKKAISTIKRYDVIVQYVEENESLGTVGSLTLLDKTKLKLPILVMNGDILTKVNYSSLINSHILDRNHITLTLRNEHIKIPFGVVKLNDKKVIEIDEKPEMNFLINAGIYVVSPEVLDLLEPNQKTDMPELINRSIQNNFLVGSFPLHEYWIDIGRHSELEKANDEYNNFFN